MIRKNIKVLTLVLAFVMIFGTTTAFAAEGDIFTKADGTLRYSANQINVSVPARNDVRVNNSLYQIEVSGVKYDLAAASAAYAQDPANWKAILSGTQGLTVVSVSAINNTTIKVKFSDGYEHNFTVAPLKDGDNTVTFEFDGVEYTETVNWVAKPVFESVEFNNYREFTVTFSGLVDHDTATNPYNYYFELVEGGVAFDPLGAAPTLGDYNQLIEVENETEFNQAGGWWASAYEHITAEDDGGKTIVTIQLPEDARFTNRVDENSDPTNTGSFQGFAITGSVATGTSTGLEDGLLNDDERTLQVVLADNVTQKPLIKNTNVLVAARNVKTVDGVRKIDTEVHEMLIQDKEGPELEITRRVRGGVEEEFDKNITLLSDGSDYIELEYDEPVFDAHDLETLAIERNVIVYVNGKFVADTKGTHGSNLAGILDFNMEFDDTYDESRVAKLDVAAAAAAARDRFGVSAAEPFLDGETLVVRILGVTDLAGNIQVPSEVEIVVEVEDPGSITPPVTPATKPEVKEVKQVTDNIFRVEFNMANVTGEFTIENADGENGKIEKYNLPLSNQVTVDGELRHFSYVVVDAIDVDSYTPPFSYDDPNSDDNDILAYDVQTQLDRTIRVRNIWSVDSSNNYLTKGDNWKQEMFPIVKDTLAPKILETPGYAWNHANIATRELVLNVEDIMPGTWTEEYENPVKALIYDYDNALTFPLDIDRNTIVGFGDDTTLNALNTGSDVAAYLPIKVSFVTDKGVTRSALLSNVRLPDTTFSQTGAIQYDASSKTLTLDLSGYTSLLTDVDPLNPLTTGELFKGVTYKVEVLKGFFADPALEDVDNFGTINDTDHADFVGQVANVEVQVTTDDIETVAAPGVAYANLSQIETPEMSGDGFEVLHVSNARTLEDLPNIIGKGYSSREQVVLFEIGEEPVVPGVDPEGLVPQTSKELIDYDQDTNEMIIEFKGEIDVKTLKDASNYTVNGKTLRAWGVADEDIVFKQEFDGSGNLTNQYAIFVVPQDSVPQNGDVQIKVSGVKNEVGGTMKEVITDVYLLDNTRPVVIKAEKQGDYQIILTFDEPLEFKEGSNQFTAANNFILKINGVEMQGSVLEARLVDGERKVTLQIGINITATTGDIVVEIVEDASNNINIIDQAKHKNPMKDGYPINVIRD